MNNNSGITSLYPSTINSEEEIKEQEKARAIVMQKLNRLGTIQQTVPVGDPTVNFISELYKTPDHKISKQEKTFLKKIPQKIKKILPINVDPNHPDGFTLKNDMDVYNNYKDTPERYVQEMIYKYDGVPVKDAVKTFDSMDSSTYPYKQKEALNAYSKVYDRLTPLQKKQIANAKKSNR